MACARRLKKRCGAFIKGAIIEKREGIVAINASFNHSIPILGAHQRQRNQQLCKPRAGPRGVGAGDRSCFNQQVSPRSGDGGSRNGLRGRRSEDHLYTPTLATAERGVKPVENTEIQCAAGAGVWAIGQGGRKGPGDADGSRSADHGDPRTRGAHPECQSRPDHSAGSLRKRSFIRWFIIDSDQQVPGSKLGGIAATWSSQLLVHPGQLSSRCWLQNAHRSRSGPGRSNSRWS